VTTNGDLISQVPNGLKFDVGGFVGVPTYGGSTNLNSTTVSDTHWLANSQYSLSNKKYDYSFFSHWIPEGTILNDVPSGSVYGDIFNSGTVSPDGYYWFKYSGPVDLHVTSLIVLGSRKAILLVEGHEVYFEGNIQVTDGSGFFMVIANKNIRIAPAVNHIQAVFVADLNFYTGTGSLPLLIKGSVVAYGQVYPGRDLGPALNATTPGTVFEYDPNLFYLYPRKLSVYKMRWKEVAP
jgi:hypothetical protein